jgi:hypothetical protein
MIAISHIASGPQTCHSPANYALVLLAFAKLAIAPQVLGRRRSSGGDRDALGDEPIAEV